MGIKKEVWEAVTAQFAADCGGNLGSAEVRRDKEGCVRLWRGPRLPGKGGMGDAAYGEWVREILQGDGACVPRVYEGTDIFFRGIVSGNEAWIMADERLYEWCRRKYIEGKGSAAWFWQAGELAELGRELGRFGRQIVDVRLHFLPGQEEPEAREGAVRNGQNMQNVQDMQNVQNTEDAGIKFRTFAQDELWGLRERYGFRHALCGSELQPDMMAAAAFCGGEAVGMAGAAADCPAMWQIGVDVKRSREGRGIGSTLVRMVKEETVKCGAVPFYGTSQSHVASMNTAIRAGMLPAWSEVYVCLFPLNML